MKKFIRVCLAIVMMLSFTACSGAETEKENELTNVANYEETVLELSDADVITTEDGRNVLRVEASYQNNGTDGMYAMCSFSVKAFQNDKEIADISDINGAEAGLIQEVKEGKTVQVSYLFELSDSSDVEVVVCTPTANEDVIAKRTYNVSEGQ